MEQFSPGWQEDIMKEARDYFDNDVSEETLELIRNKIEQVMLNSLRPKMYWVQKSTPLCSLAACWHCSNCGNDEMYKTPFCPICGAMNIEND